MFGKLGMPELILILAIALIIFGPRKLPEIGRSIGKGIREFRQATTEMQKSIDLDEEIVETKEKKSEKEEMLLSEEDNNAGETEKNEQKV
ncbi:MAG: twin-arginine translocase TatA/TatE family subunit [Bacillota bacterium]|nr:twin-arginine translocase TatA/TatE family subunit [Bacillota bacterium]